MKKYKFQFTRTRFFGLSHEDEPCQESVEISARSFQTACKQLKEHLQDAYQGSNCFEHFFVSITGKKGLIRIQTLPQNLFDIHGIARDARFILKR